jgi:FKBP-type peptidyl-prolyl cis-trans isomerase
MRFSLLALSLILISCSSSSSSSEPASTTSSAAPASPAPAAPAQTAPPAQGGEVKTASGLVYKEMRAGSGASPHASDVVKVNYRGTLTNGTEFDSSYKRNMPAEFPLDHVIPCWTEGVQMMKVGGKAQLTCPPAIAYGERGAPPAVPPNATLIFEVELLGINGQ